MHICLNRGTAGRDLPYDEFVKLSAQAGFPGVDVDMGWGQMQGAKALGDLLGSHNQKPGGWAPALDWRGDIARLNDGLPNLEKQANVAQQLGIDSCATYILPSSDLPFTENWSFHVQRLRRIAEVLASRGLRFGLEFVAPYHLRRRWRHEFIFTAGQMLELAADVGENVGLLVDCFHVHTAGDTWQRVADVPAGKIVLAHLNDAPPIPVAEIDDGNRLLPGEGAIDVAAFIGALKKSGYEGPVSLEVFTAELRALPPLEAAEKAWAATQKVTGALP
ncbi:MAG TPA: sugar phosphate isomerase/epimerase family protein [Tepidisphaeraceae bacterium]|nr:sugar phosphate isomerase/epimerase family protein [Tepidisphaeraceae bacterium]